MPSSHIRLIRRIPSDHPEWGEDRAALELQTKAGLIRESRACRDQEFFRLSIFAVHEAHIELVG